MKTNLNDQNYNDKPIREIIKPIGESILKLRDNLGKVEKEYYSKYYRLEKRKIINERIDAKLDKLQKIQKKDENNFDEDILVINAGGGLFETRKSLVRNCRYPNILSDLIDNRNNYSYNDPLILDLDDSVFEVILEIIRFTQIEDENSILIKSLDEALEYNKLGQTEVDPEMERNIIKTLKEKDKKIFRIYDKELMQGELPIELLVENIKLFFPHSWENLLEEIEIKGYNPNKKKANINVEVIIPQVDYGTAAVNNTEWYD